MENRDNESDEGRQERRGARDIREIGQKKSGKGERKIDLLK